MDPLTGALIIGGVSAVGNYIGGQDTNATNAALQGQAETFNAGQQASQNAFNAQQVAQQEQYQTQMSNTAYQRATADMRAAGINPMLAYMQGGASSPSGGAASGNPVPAPTPRPAANPVGDATRGLLGGISSGYDAAKADNDLKTGAVQRSLIGAQTDTAKAQASFYGNSARKAAADAVNAEAQSDAIAAGAALDAKQSRQRMPYVTPDDWTQRIGRNLGIVTNAVKAFSPFSGGGGALPDAAPPSSTYNPSGSSEMDRFLRHEVP